MTIYIVSKLFVEVGGSRMERRWGWSGDNDDDENNRGDGDGDGDGDNDVIGGPEKMNSIYKFCFLIPMLSFFFFFLFVYFKLE